MNKKLGVPLDIANDSVVQGLRCDEADETNTVTYYISSKKD